MTEAKDPAHEVRDVIETLIQNVSRNNDTILDEIYHHDMQVIMLDPDDGISVSDKNAMKDIIRSALEANNGTIGTWAKFHHITVDGDSAHVLVSRQNELTGPDLQITLGIDLKRERDRWQITREVIVTRPRSEAA
ncbi:hypothetical protein [Roseibium album]|uniref:hypothetical protein n=1 Tax=Roseibium album TaxID=311410 RepID=UPI002492E505|nr:hypothetical protein [Roseibium album]